MAPRTQTFKIPSGVRLFGGFNGSEVTLNQRNFVTNVTTLSGNSTTYHVVFFYHVGAIGTIIDGFTISDGMADGIDPNNHGAGIYNNGSQNNNISNPIVKNCILVNNKSSDIGGAVYNSGDSGGTTSPSFVKCVFSNNEANGNGAGIITISTNDASCLPSFYDCVFSENKSGGNGGGVYVSCTDGSCSQYFENCLFSNNLALSNGAVGNSGLNAIYTQIFMNVTFYNNTANQGKILRSVDTGSTTMTNCILWDTISSTNLISLLDDATLIINFSDVIGGWSGTGTNNIDSDPMFTNESNLIGPDNIWATNDDGLTLQSGSPALNSGTLIGAPQTDIIGNPYIFLPPMGCYGAIPLPPTTTSTTMSPPHPVVNNIYPNIGLTTGGQTVLITGSGFIIGSTTVTIGGITVPTLVNIHGSFLTFVTPKLAVGSYSILVITPFGTAALPTPFVVIPNVIRNFPSEYYYRRQCMSQIKRTCH